MRTFCCEDGWWESTHWACWGPGVWSSSNDCMHPWTLYFVCLRKKSTSFLSYPWFHPITNNPQTFILYFYKDFKNWFTFLFNMSLRLLLTLKWSKVFNENLTLFSFKKKHSQSLGIPLRDGGRGDCRSPRGQRFQKNRAHRITKQGYRSLKRLKWQSLSLCVSMLCFLYICCGN